MPEISDFFGIHISINYSDHNPPHVHAVYGEYKALIDIQQQCAMRGYLPGKQLKLVLAWCVMHEEELMENWRLVRAGQKPHRIAPLAKG